jgi:AmiR/NasT family two-component response regulator
MSDSSSKALCVVPLTDGFGTEVVAAVSRSMRELTGAGWTVTTVLADLSEVSTLPATGVRALVDVRRLCQDAGVQLRVVAAGPLRRVLEGTDAAWRGAVYPSVPLAVPSAKPLDTPVAVLNERLRHREHQLANLPIIEQAKGMLMQDFRLGPDEAFEVIKRLSQESNGKVRDVAAQLTGRFAGQVAQPSAEDVQRMVRALRAQLPATQPGV